MGWLGKTYRWFDDRLGLGAMYRVLLRHPIPPALSGKWGWVYVFGTATLTVFIVQVVTGVALATAYVPSTQSAYDSLQFITNDAFLGNLVRGTHYYGASLMVIMVVVHMTRVFLTGSYKFPREFNWLTGVLLLLLVFGMAFTGQLLRWDEDAIGSVLVAVEQAGRVPFIGDPLGRFLLGGKTIGGSTLTRFYALHVFVLPGAIFAVIGVHLFLILRHGISEPPRAGQPVEPERYRAHYEADVKRGGKFYFPDSMWKEAVVAGLVVLIIIGLAIAFGPKSLGLPPDPTNTDVNPRPDWYMIWLFGLLAVVPYAIEDYLIVFGPLITITVLVALPLLANRGERAVSRRPWASAVVTLAFLGVAVLLYTGFASPWSPNFGTKPFTAEALGVSSGPELEGAQVFYQNGCQYCHSVMGRGGSRGPDLTHVLSRLTPEEVVQRILSPPPNMPSYNNKISEQDLDRILAFLKYVDNAK